MQFPLNTKIAHSCFSSVLTRQCVIELSPFELQSGRDYSHTTLRLPWKVSRWSRGWFVNTTQAGGIVCSDRSLEPQLILALPNASLNRVDLWRTSRFGRPLWGVAHRGRRHHNSAELHYVEAIVEARDTNLIVIAVGSVLALGRTAAHSSSYANHQDKPGVNPEGIHQFERSPRQLFGTTPLKTTSSDAPQALNNTKRHQFIERIYRCCSRRSLR